MRSYKRWTSGFLSSLSVSFPVSIPSYSLVKRISIKTVFFIPITVTLWSWTCVDDFLNITIWTSSRQSPIVSYPRFDSYYRLLHSYNTPHLATIYFEWLSSVVLIDAYLKKRKEKKTLFSWLKKQWTATFNDCDIEICWLSQYIYIRCAEKLVRFLLNLTKTKKRKLLFNMLRGVSLKPF